MSHSYNVRFWKLQVIPRARRSSNGVRWTVDGIPFRATFATKALAESHRSDLLAAARRGEAFDTETGRPISWKRDHHGRSWYDFAVDYTDLKWKGSAANSRRSRAEALTAITTALLPQGRGRPAERVLRAALRRWAFNTAHRDGERPNDIDEALRWAHQHAPQVSALARPDTLRAILDAIATKLDGTTAAATVFTRRRMVLSNALNYAVERELLDYNPLARLKNARPAYRNRGVVDRRSVVNPAQARGLLDAVGWVQTSGPRLVAFFATLYYAALRPEEAVDLRSEDLDLPDQGWGELHLHRAAPHVGGEWTDSGQPHDERGLKHRAHDATRTVSCPPELTAILHRHLQEHGTDSEGRLFWGVRGGPLAGTTYASVWRQARQRAFGAEAARSPLARRPYDLRHAALSTWLNAGVPPTDVAERAGNSVAVLLRVYAACLDSTEQATRRRIDAALRFEVGDRISDK